MEPDFDTCGMTNWVGSFDPIMFIYFMLATVLIPYPVYVFVATVFNWEHRAKRPARHYQDVLHATSYGVIVFIFGNYAQTLKYVHITQQPSQLIHWLLLVALSTQTYLQITLLCFAQFEI